MFSFRHFAVTALVCLISSCGGGGGGGGGGGSSGPPPPARGAFTMSGNNASFILAEYGSQAPTQSFNLTVTGRDVSFVGAAYLNGQTPAPWLQISMSGSGTQYSLLLGVSQIMPAGNYSATFAVGTADSTGAVLQQQNFTVQLQVYGRTLITTSQVQRNYIFGDALRTDSVSVAVQGPARPWSLSSDVSWLRPPTAAQTGNQTLNAAIDITGMAPGYYAGHITATDNADAGSKSTMEVAIMITAPTFSATQESLLFGGVNGNEALTSQAVNFTLTTGAGVHPYTATVTTDSGGSWLQVSSAAGNVGAAGATVMLSVVPGQLTGATRTGHLLISTNVYGTTYTDTVAVTWNREANTLVVSESGIALSRVAGRSVLTRTLKVFSGANRPDTPWSAVSDSPWLSVTPSGVAGGDLVLTATPGALALDTTHFANVTITSSDPLVINQQSVRVGLHLSNTAPANVQFPSRVTRITTSPVEPILAVVDDSSDVRIYDVYSGALLRTLTGVAARATALHFKGDGTVLYVYDSTNLVVRAIDPNTGSILGSYDSVSQSPSGDIGWGIETVRPNGHEVLITPGGRVYDLATGSAYPLPSPYHIAYLAFSFTHSLDQSIVMANFGVLSRFRVTALRGGGLEIDPFVSSIVAESHSCFSASGDRAYGNSNAFPYIFPATSIATGEVIQELPGEAFTGFVLCSWNGIVVGQTSPPKANLRVFYGPTGASLATLDAGLEVIGNHYPDGAGTELSSDSTRIISVTNYNGVEVSPRINFQMLPPPP